MMHVRSTCKNMRAESDSRINEEIIDMTTQQNIASPFRLHNKQIKISRT